MKTNRESPLKAEVKDGKLVISIGVDRLGDDRERTGILVTNSNECAHSMAEMMCRDNEVGASILTELLDDALNRLCNEGYLGVERECSHAEPQIKATFKWIPTVQCNGSYASMSSSHAKRCVTRDIHEALQFDTFESCQKWCAIANETSKAAYVPAQHGFAVKVKPTRL